MKNTSHDIAAASAMLERAAQILELTHHDWRLHERPKRRGKDAKKQNRCVSYDRPGSLDNAARHNAFA